jgi:hypothetical protein
MEDSIIWLVKLILAHLVSDFWLQPTKWVEHRGQHKVKSKYLYLHVLVTGITALAFVGINYWQAVLFITLSHLVIDLIKAYLKKSFTNFVIDQLLHLLMIAICWMWIFEQHRLNIQSVYGFYTDSKFWIFATCAFFLSFPSSIIIGQATRQWNVPAGLKNAGKYIGIIERLLICVLVYNGQYEAIGLLITGKSILRYNSSNEEVKTEYLLIGTLLSIFIAFSTGLVLRLMVL